MWLNSSIVILMRIALACSVSQQTFSLEGACFKHTACLVGELDQGPQSGLNLK